MLDVDDDEIVSKDAFKYNKARQELMKTHNCWTCCYLGYNGKCNPLKGCYKERLNARIKEMKNERLQGR